MCQARKILVFSTKKSATHDNIEFLQVWVWHVDAMPSIELCHSCFPGYRTMKDGVMPNSCLPADLNYLDGSEDVCWGLSHNDVELLVLALLRPRTMKTPLDVI